MKNISKCILIIDDDEDDQDIFITAVQKISSSIRCIALTDASEALDKLVKKVIFPDLIFLDLNMPVMTGQQFLHEIKKNDDLINIPIIVLSTTSHKSTIQITKDLGARDFITKPRTFDELINVLDFYI